MPRPLIPRPAPVHPAADVLRFGKTPYRNAYRKVQLTPDQQATAGLIMAISEAASLRDLPRLLGVLQHADYQVLTRIKGRQAFHSPFTDLFINLANPKAQARLLAALTSEVEHPVSRRARDNALNALADLYFDSLRPGGRLDGQKAGRFTLKRYRQNALPQKLLSTFDRWIQPTASDPDLARQVRQQLRIHWLQYVMTQTWLPDSAFQEGNNRTIREQIIPLITRPLPEPPERSPVPEALVHKLEAALLDENPEPLRAMSRSRELTRIIPEWGRLVGACNVQHSDQHYTLEEHSLNAVMHAKRSPFYARLSPREKRLATMATLLHDIGKDTGPANLQPLIPPDRPHPLKSEIIVRQILPSLGYTSEETDTIGRLVLYHQMLGGMCTRYEDRPDDAFLEQAASLVLTPSELRMLQALTEGDIRSVKRDSAWFTPVIAGRLEKYGGMVEERIRRNRSMDLVVPHGDPQAVLAELWQKRTPHNSRVTADLDSLLKDMAGSFRRVGYSMNEDVHAFRLPYHGARQWLTMEVTDLAPGGLQDGLFDHSLKLLRLRNIRDFDGAKPPYGFIVEVHPEQVAYAGPREMLGRSPEAALRQDHAYRQIMNGDTGDETLGRLWVERVRRTGQPVKPDQENDPVVLAIRPRIRAVYVRQDKRGEPLQLPEALKAFIRTHRLPVAIVS